MEFIGILCYRSQKVYFKWCDPHAATAEALWVFIDANWCARLVTQNRSGSSYCTASKQAPWVVLHSTATVSIPFHRSVCATTSMRKHLCVMCWSDSMKLLLVSLMYANVDWCIYSCKHQQFANYWCMRQSLADQLCQQHNIIKLHVKLHTIFRIYVQP